MFRGLETCLCRARHGRQARLSVIQALILVGLEAVSDVLQQEAGQRAGVRCI